MIMLFFFRNIYSLLVFNSRRDFLYGRSLVREGILADVREAKEIYEENRRKMMYYHSRLREMLDSDQSNDLSWIRAAQSELADAYYSVEADCL